MPRAKAKPKKFMVWMKFPVTNHWQVIAYDLSASQSTSLDELIDFDTRVEEIDSDD